MRVADKPDQGRRRAALVKRDSFAVEVGSVEDDIPNCAILAAFWMGLNDRATVPGAVSRPSGETTQLAARDIRSGRCQQAQQPHG